MRSRSRSWFGAGTTLLLLACGGRDGADFLGPYGSVNPPITGGTNAGGSVTGGSAAGGSVTGGSATGGFTTGGFTSGGTGAGGSGGIPVIAGGSFPTGGFVGVGGATSVGGGFAMGGSSGIGQCDNYCAITRGCGEDPALCEQSCRSYVYASPIPQCIDIRLKAVECVAGALGGSGCAVDTAYSKCADYINQADACLPPMPAGTCEEHCTATLTCGGFYSQPGYANCVNSCYSEMSQFYGTCYDYFQAYLICNTSALGSGQCNYDSANACYPQYSRAYECQYMNPMPPIPPVPVPPNGCLGSVNVGGYGYCDAYLTCGTTNHSLGCYPNQGYTECSCYSEAQGVATSYTFQVPYGDCQAAIVQCSHGSFGAPAGGAGGSAGRAF